MKDALGHGSNGKGGAQTPVQQENAPFKSRLPGKSYLDPNDPRNPANLKMTATQQRKSGAEDAAFDGTKGLHSAGVQSTPQLQRRHFEAIAADLKAQAPKSWGDNSSKANSDANGAHMAKVNDVADKLAMTNPGFRRDFFVKAATPGGAYNNKSRERSATKPGFASKVSRAKKFAGM